jgi:hypothetical protein
MSTDLPPIETAPVGGLCPGQVLGEDQKIISRRVEIVDDCLRRITTDFVEAARRRISRSPGRFYQQQTAPQSLHLGFYAAQQGTANTTSLSCGVHRDPVQVEGALSQRMGTEASKAKYVVPIAIHQKGISAGLSFISVCVP